MQRHKARFDIAPADREKIKVKMLDWVSRSGIFLFLDSNSYPSAFPGYECLAAAGAVKVLTATDQSGLGELMQLHLAYRDWLFGHICYDFSVLPVARQESVHPAVVGFPPFRFFIPETVCHINRAQTDLVIESFEDPVLVYKAITEMPGDVLSQPLPKLDFKKGIDREDYLAAISGLRSHIADGDCYEINFCNEGVCDKAIVDPLSVFKALNKLSPAPFAAYYKCDDKYMMCASPERYLRKERGAISSQPIKGTARRGGDQHTDNEIKEQLYNDVKERAENVMIVDLVRNDLARCCETGSIKVDELFGVYTFPQVHQLISTVSGTLRAGMTLTDAITCTFPMGSMTGAPKHKVMQLIDRYEASRRELFSGTVGYITPGGDFDFNVVIRSLFYNSTLARLSYQTGGAITYDSNAEQEWEEMRLKAWALERIFSGAAETRAGK